MAKRRHPLRGLCFVIVITLMFPLITSFQAVSYAESSNYDEGLHLLEAPGNLAVSNITSTSMNLTWDTVTGASYSDVRYKVTMTELAESSVTGEVYNFDVAGLNVFTVDGLTADRGYTFVVQAMDAAGPVSKPSGPVIARTLPSGVLPSLPPTPGIQQINRVQMGVPELKLTNLTSNSISLAWTLPDHVGIAKYVLYQNANRVSELTVNTTVYTAVNLEAGQEYIFQVQAIDVSGKNAILSNELKVTTLDKLKTSSMISMSNGYSFHTLAVQPDGTLWAWGKNDKGQLGDNTSIYRNKPGLIVGLPAISAASVGQNHSIALATDGTVWTWGGNGAGQLGNGTLENQFVPQQVIGLEHAVAVQAGEQHSLALLADGTVWAWGLNAYGQLGDGSTENRTLPVQVADLGEIASISAGVFHNLAIDRDGQVYAWGFNAYGQLGDNSNMDRATPVLVAQLSDIASVSAGFYHSIAVKNDGTVWSWGTNAMGVLGDGTTNDHYTPVQVLNLTSIVSVSAGAIHNIALKNDGSVWIWGANNEGQLGDGTKSGQSFPTKLDFESRIASVRAGYMSSGAVSEEGAVLTWGYNGYGQLGDGTQGNVLHPNTIQLVDANNELDI